MKSNALIAPLTLAVLITSSQLQAQDAITDTTTADAANSGDFQWVLSAGITIGGDDFVEVYDDDGDHTDDIEAGGLLYFAAGGNYRFANSPLSIQGVFGYHFDSADGDNGDASFDRTLIDLTAFYNFGQHRIGLGMTHHFSPTLDIDIDFYNDTIDFDDTNGFLVEYDYMTTENIAIGIRYTNIEYDINSADSFMYVEKSYDGSNIGLFIYGLF